MAPEYGATMGFFPIDEETLDYLRATGRTDAEVQLVERYTKEQGLFRTDDAPTPEVHARRCTLDLGTVEPSLAGPKRPQDRVPLADVQAIVPQVAAGAGRPSAASALDERRIARTAHGRRQRPYGEIGHGAVVIAAITSCTNTSNPVVMLAAGLLAKKAVEQGLTVKPYVKTSLAPGIARGDRLSGQGRPDQAARSSWAFNTVGYGCTTCIGNSGPLPRAGGQGRHARATWWPRRCSAAIATSRAASIRW